MSASEILEQDRMTKALLYVMYSMIDLEANGYIKNAPIKETEKGREGYKLLKESGFKPTNEEVAIAMAVLTDEKTYE